MILIADSGSTKTTWALLSYSGKVEKEVLTSGINPYFLDCQEIVDLLNSELIPVISGAVRSVYFYGAGCGNPEKKGVVKKALSQCFPDAACEVESDMLGAARALFGNQKGIACILGTGSNSCLYDGEKILANVSPGGFILGDEGSGAVMGKKLAGDFVKGIMPSHLEMAFSKNYQIDKNELIDRVYRKPFPNRFLASFTRFVADNIHDTYCNDIVHTSFMEFITRNIEQYPDYKKHPVGFVGSVAQVFENVLDKAMNERGLEIHSVMKNPITGLVDCHSKKA